MNYRAQQQNTANYKSIELQPLGYSLLHGLACASKKVFGQKMAVAGGGPCRIVTAKARHGRGKADKSTPRTWFLALGNSGDKLPSMIVWGYIQVA